jgi:putative flippase GtrA
MKYIKKLFSIRIIRYGIVGGAGIPINLIALAIFIHIFGQQGIAGWLSVVFAFEVSTTINFVLNQTFTYHDQKLSGRSEWIKRAAKAQVTSLSSQLITLGIKYGLHFGNPYVADSLGIICGFLFQFFVTNKFVFRPTEKPTMSPMSPMPPQEQLMLADETQS